MLQLQRSETAEIQTKALIQALKSHMGLWEQQSPLRTIGTLSFLPVPPSV